jgi:hypothetical protein
MLGCPTMPVEMGMIGLARFALPRPVRAKLSPAEQTASKFPLRWWIINSTVFAYIGSTRSQGRIAGGIRFPVRERQSLQFYRVTTIRYGRLIKPNTSRKL